MMCTCILRQRIILFYWVGLPKAEDTGPMMRVIGVETGVVFDIDGYPTDAETVIESFSSGTAPGNSPTSC